MSFDDCAHACLAGDADRVVAALLDLLVRMNTGRGCWHMVQAIEHHLALLAADPHAGAGLRETAQSLAGAWREAMDQAAASGSPSSAQRRH